MWQESLAKALQNRLNSIGIRLLAVGTAHLVISPNQNPKSKSATDNPSETQSSQTEARQFPILLLKCHKSPNPAQTVIPPEP